MKLLCIEHIDDANAITHGGVFHADEVLATAILDFAIDDLKVCRVAHVASVPEDAVVYDIGGGVFDHHQHGGNGVRANGVPYASAGLIWRAFGMHVVKNAADPEKAWHLIERDLIQGVDAADNGLIDSDSCAVQLTFSKIISLLNPEVGSSQVVVDEAFCEAVELAKLVLVKVLERVNMRLKCASIVEEAIRSSENHILDLPYVMPWVETLHESEDRNADGVYFVVYPSVREGFCWRCVPTKAGGKDQRLQVPKSWWGLCGDELRKASGIEDAIFCHASGFMGVVKSREGAQRMAQNAIRQSDSQDGEWPVREMPYGLTCTDTELSLTKQSL